MPAIRGSAKTLKNSPRRESHEYSEITIASPENKSMIVRRSVNTHYPRSEAERASFRTRTGKRVTQHHWAVYDHILLVPAGTVTTYKDVSLAVGGSPRSVGNALRNNPFSPYVPCHRVVASDLCLGGFFGEWGKAHRTGTKCEQKMKILTDEGVEFTKGGKVAHPETVLWKA